MFDPISNALLLFFFATPNVDFVRLNKYPLVPLERIASGKWIRPRATVIGTVTYVKREADRDWHIRLEEGGRFIICEIIPELPGKPPRVGDRIVVKGIVRWDAQHRWAELHPVTGWQKIQ